MTYLPTSNVHITGGTADNLVLGGTTPAAATFSQITNTGATVQPSRVVTASGDITQSSTDTVIVVNKNTGAATTVTLLASPPAGTRILIIDGKGDADVNPITILPQGSATISALPNYIINVVHGSVELLFSGSAWVILHAIVASISQPIAQAVITESPEGSFVITPTQTIYSSKTTNQVAPTGGPYDTWTITANPGQVVHNGTTDTSTANVKYMYYHTHAVYHENTSNNWYYWNTQPGTSVNMLKNSSNVAAVAGTPGTLPQYWTANLAGLTQTMVGTGTDSSTGLPYIDFKVAGTNTATAVVISFDTGITVAALANYAIEATVALVGGSMANIDALHLNWDEGHGDLSAGYLTSVTSFTPSSSITATPLQITKTAQTQATTNIIGPYLSITSPSTGLAINVTLRIMGVQFQPGTSSTAFQPTPVVPSGWVQTTTPIPTTMTVNMAPIADVPVSNAFVVSGTLQGYSSAPTLVYRDNAGSFVSLPSGATVTATSWSFLHPAISSVSSGNTITVKDAVNIVNGPNNVITTTSTSNAFAVYTPATVTLTGITLSNSTIAASVSSGTTVGAITVTVAGGTWTGTLSVTGGDAASFTISGTNLVTVGTLSARSYSINIVATMTNATNSPLSVAKTIVASATSVVHYGTTAPTSIPNVTGAVSPLGWTLQFFDDFTSFSQAGDGTRSATTGAHYPYGSSTLAKWGTQDGGERKHLQQWCNVDDTPLCNPFSQSGSVLNITASVPNSAQLAQLSGKTFISGSLNSKFNWAGGGFCDDIVAGYFECNMKLPAGFNGNNGGFWGAWWISAKNWPPEMDIIEQRGTNPNNMDATVWYDVGGAQHSGTSINTTVDLTAGFHTYGGLITPNYLAWYFDGTLVRQTTLGIGTGVNFFGGNAPTNTCSMILDFALGDAAQGDEDGQTVTAAQLPATMSIDWVRYSLLGPA